MAEAVVVSVTLFFLGFWHWQHHVINPSHMSGDKWYMRRMAYTDQPVSPPYCWRPLLPFLARLAGFSVVSYAATAITPLIIYWYLGSGWSAAAVALMFVGSRDIFSFNIRNPEYAESIGQFLVVSGAWALRDGALWPAAVVLILGGLTRETVACLLALLAIFSPLWFLAPLPILGLGAAYLTRREDKTNRHPLVEGSPYETLVRWAKVKGEKCLHYAHTVQTFRGLTFSVPFVWSQADAWARCGLLGFIPIWLLALPASGQTRIMSYGFILLAPFAVAAGSPWVWFLLLLHWFWPIDYALYEEGGGQDFGILRGTQASMQPVQQAVHEQDPGREEL